MMRKFDFIFVFLLVAIFLLTSCGGNDVEVEKSSPAPEKTAESTTQPGQSAENGVKTIRLVTNRLVNGDIESNKIVEALEKGMAEDGTPLRLELEDFSPGDYTQKLSALLNAGELPDLIFFTGHVDLQFAEDKRLTDLTPFIEKSQNIKPLLDSYNLKRLENYPYLLNIAGLTPNVPLIRRDWLDRLSSKKKLLDAPTVENYYAFLKELKDKDLDGKGNPIVGITTDGYINELDSIFNMAFGITGTWRMDEKAGRYVYSRTTPFEKAKLAFYHRLYSEGILGPKDKAKTSYNKLQLFYSGEAGVVCGSGWEINSYDRRIRALYGDKAELAALPPAKGVSQGYGPAGLLKETDGFGISADSKEPELAFAVLEYMAGPKGRKIDWLGLQGRHFDINDGAIVVNPEYEDWIPVFWSTPKGLQFDMPLSKPVISSAALASAEMAEKSFVPDTYFLMYNMEDEYIKKDEYYKAWYYIEKLYADFSSDIIAGHRSIDEFDAFVKRWYENGGEVITRYANRNIDAAKCAGIDLK
jgi:putative aldouronate transport system substrate-binding protein